ncbi:hypothetical protein, partial [Bacillus sp. SIMBA_005]
MTPTSTDAVKTNLNEAGSHLAQAARDATSAVKSASAVAADELKLGKASVKADLADSAISGIAAFEEGQAAVKE